MKTTLKEIRRLIATGAAEDITTATNIRDIDEAEHGFTSVLYSVGTYGCTGAVVKGNTTGKLYAVKARSSNLFYVL